MACERLRPSTSDWWSDLESAWSFGCLRRFTSTPSDSSRVMPAPRRCASCSLKRYCCEWLSFMPPPAVAGAAPAPGFETASVFPPASAVLAAGDFAEDVSFCACAPTAAVAGLFCCGAAAPASTGCTRIGTQRFCSTIAIAAERSLAVTTPSTSVPWALRALYRNSGMSPECCVSGNHKGKPSGLPSCARNF